MTFIYKRAIVYFGGIFIIAGVCILVVYKRQESKFLQTATQIYNVMDQYRLTYDIDAASMDPAYDRTPKPVSGIAEFQQRLEPFVKRNQPIQMVLVGFPFKKAKAIGDPADMAERKSLEYLEGMLDQIKNVYAPGAQITIFCDGAFFAKIFGVQKNTLLAYENTLRILAADLPNIKLYTSADIMQKHKLENFDAIGTILPPGPGLKTHAQPIAEITKKRIAAYIDGTKLLEHRTLDQLVFEMMEREDQLRAYIQQQFPEDQYMRLSAHFSKDISKKFGIKLSPNSNITPYHGVLVEKNGTWSIQFKKDVDTRHYMLVTKNINGIMCSYFVSTT